MPIPSPNHGESRSEYVSRVMPMLSKERPGNQKQAVAIAFSEWKRHKAKGRQAKAGRRKARKMFVKKSNAQDVSKLLMAGVSLITGQHGQGDVFYSKGTGVARVVFRPDRDSSYFDEWKTKVASVLGLNETRISVSPSAPKEWGEGSDWVKVSHDGSVEIDPGLQAPQEPEPEPRDQQESSAEEAPLDGPESEVPTPPVTVRIAARYVAREQICKVEEEPDYTFVLAAALVPDRPDMQGDVIDSHEIEKAAHGFVENSQRSGVQHKAKLKKREAVLVESYIVRAENYEVNGFKLPVGTWMTGWRAYDRELRDSLKSGFFRGLSIAGEGRVEPIT
jgi:hypothetical protein